MESGHHQRVPDGEGAKEGGLQDETAGAFPGKMQLVTELDFLFGKGNPDEKR